MESDTRGGRDASGLEEHVRHEILETEGYFTDKFRAAHPENVEEFWKRAWKTLAGCLAGASWLELWRRACF